MWFRKPKKPAADEVTGAWSVQAVSRIRDARDGQTIEYPARLAVCPRGHVRSLPTRFSSPITQLRCEACTRSYPIDLS